MVILGLGKRKLKVKCTNNPVCKDLLKRKVVICSQRALQTDYDKLNEFVLYIFWDLLLGSICGAVPKYAR